MNDIDEKNVFDIADAADEKKLSEVLEGMDILEAADISDDTILDIKAKTWKKLGITPAAAPLGRQEAHRRAPARRARFTAWTPAAAAVLILALVLTAFNFNTVLAEVRKLLVFIPGVNRVIDKSEDTVYILPKPVKAQQGQGEITVTGVSVDSKNAVVTMWGKNTAVPKEVFFIDGKGMEYQTKSFDVWGGGKWQGTYTCSGAINGGKVTGIMIRDLDGLRIPLQLEEAKAYEAISEMGPTAYGNNMSITAVPQIEQGRLKINLISPMEEGTMLVSFGDYGKDLRLTDHRGNGYTLWRPDTGFLSRDMYYFDIGSGTGEAYSLNIPYLEIEKQDQDSRNTVKLSVPREGRLDINKATELAGFPFVIKAIERTAKDSIRIYVDMGFDSAAARSLKQFDIGLVPVKIPGAAALAGEFKKIGTPIGYNSEKVQLSHSMKFSEATGEAEYFEIEADPDTDSIILLMSRPLIVVRGPWSFEIDP